ncbi:hypothetical protein [Thysanoplusia orichalcea nucleopolyhedrovirus]|uniref:Uncharacterized protein n=1 Tax=Thysanoplusia orichalcea nucleopolyhedrovirus TaxID=101850 RepID=L0CLY1_9ABAC|nr:hypothetical protein [Thysanoplusia orichalcea nucleopolyhedrovirus]AGA16236.1 hypothetical protein [Thysanoplusia orichalcea nucleopolyhedrovirus]
MKLLAILILFYSFLINMQAAPSHYEANRCTLSTRIGWNSDGDQDPNIYWRC